MRLKSLISDRTVYNSQVMPKNTSKLITSIAICESAGLLGTIFTVSSITNWYNFLNQPSFRPPNWLFGPVWTILYLFMGISFCRVWIKLNKNKEVGNALKLFLIQLAVNASWSIIFFGLHSIFGALLTIAILWILIVKVISTFYQIDKPAAFLLAPYLAWVSFATVLNFSIWQLNK